MRIDIKLYDDSGILQQTLSAEPERVEFEDVYQGPDHWVFPASRIHAPKRTGLDIHLIHPEPNKKGVIYTFWKRPEGEVMPKCDYPACGSGLEAKYALILGADGETDEEVLTHRCPPCLSEAILNDVFTRREIDSLYKI